MINKNLRLISVINVKDNKAVQSFKYKNYLPLGKVDVLIKNLDRWQSDEILINCIDRSLNQQGPNFEIVKKISKLKISTPLIYGGGIRNLNDALSVIKFGADRILLETLIYKDFNELQKIKKVIGSQAIIMSLPLVLKNKRLYQFNYIKNNLEKININFLKSMKEKLISEILIIDKDNDGSIDNNYNDILKYEKFFGIPIIFFGGINNLNKIKRIQKYKNLSAIAIGNSLNYSEHKVQYIKNNLAYFRRPFYETKY